MESFFFIGKKAFKKRCIKSIKPTYIHMNQTLVQHHPVKILLGIDKDAVKLHMSEKYASLVTDKEARWLPIFFSEFIIMIQDSLSNDSHRRIYIFTITRLIKYQRCHTFSLCSIYTNCNDFLLHVYVIQTQASYQTPITDIA